MGLWYGDSAKDSVVYNYMNPQCASHSGGGNLCALGAVPCLYLLGLGRVHVYTY